jgi:hypothetical protein
LSDLNHLIDLSLDEGTVWIGVAAFETRYSPKAAACSASPIAIEPNAFQCGQSLCQIAFPVGSEFQDISIDAS